MTFPPELLGPVGALALALVGLGLFYTGRILSRAVVPREDYEAVIAINAQYAQRFGEATETIRGLGATIEKLTTAVERSARR